VFALWFCRLTARVPEVVTGVPETLRTDVGTVIATEVTVPLVAVTYSISVAPLLTAMYLPPAPVKLGKRFVLAAAAVVAPVPPCATVIAVVNPLSEVISEFAPLAAALSAERAPLAVVLPVPP